MKDGTYRMCATSPEQSALHETGAIRGGVDTVHPHERLVGDVMCCAHQLLLVHCVIPSSAACALCVALVCFFWFIV